MLDVSDCLWKSKMRQPGIEPGPLPWKGRILTIRPLTLYVLGKITAM